MHNASASKNKKYHKGLQIKKDKCQIGLQI